ncbi:hypothetical protein [Neogemmobacter tilapiae]|uniref:Uncharacterized protein n=1 Tax=Neogemmobacter tilapiae TaxID=875041 RepID=A0A918TNF3_9RHOB|nr:hypothetical protein [Gemmobacter tilapiae]GHC55464.1 hypothetical protein GCM10007315_18010 [Gemmobacter tilapiae]
MTASQQMNIEQIHALGMVQARMESLNTAIREAVEAGVSVQLERASRYHCGKGGWGDVMAPVVVKVRD